MAGASLRIATMVLATMLLGNACGVAIETRGPPLPTPPAASPSAPAGSLVPLPSGSTTPSPAAPGFAFTADAVILFYEDAGYFCTKMEPSAKAAGFFFRQCEFVDAASRTRTVGIVTDPSGALANGYASVEGAEAEAFLAPADALEPLAGFLGAMLGKDRGSGVLAWLAGHLGDAFAETTIDALRIATYSESEVDHSKLYVELANQAYLDAPGE